MKSYLGNKKYPRGFRNNNPGNIIFKQSNNWLGKIPFDKNTDKTFEQFINFEYGVRALITDLITKYTNGLRTIKDIMIVYSPVADGNNTKAYIEVVSTMTGLHPETVFELTKDNVRKIVKAIVKVENNLPLEEEEFNTAFELLDSKKKKLLR